jgi:hypothetical protein
MIAEARALPLKPVSDVADQPPRPSLASDVADQSPPPSPTSDAADLPPPLPFDWKGLYEHSGMLLGR